MSEAPNELCYTLPAAHSRREPNRRDQSKSGTSQGAAALPRISRLMALAIHLEETIGRRDLDYGELAWQGRVSRTRVTQILNLLHLAPDIQEGLLFLPARASGRDLICERKIRALASEYDWERQRLAFYILIRNEG